MTAITRALAEFVAGLSDERLPRQVPERAKLLVFDSVGIALRARHEADSTPSLVAAAQKLGLTGARRRSSATGPAIPPPVRRWSTAP